MAPEVANNCYTRRNVMGSEDVKIGHNMDGMTLSHMDQDEGPERVLVFLGCLFRAFVRAMYSIYCTNYMHIISYI
jgi:hypothetical protein